MAIMPTLRIILPYQLYTLAHSDSEITLELAGAATLGAVLDALEAAYPMLAGAVRDRVSGQRRPLIRFFACQDDLSNNPPDAPLPDAVAAGHEPLLIVGAIAGG
jgi:hypothetical protein